MIVKIDQFRRAFAKWLARTLAKTPITPTQINLLRLVVAGPASLYFFSRGEYVSNLIGLAVYLPMAILDFVDGEVARLKNVQSKFGDWIDSLVDAHLMLFVMLAIFYGGITNSDFPVMWLWVSLLFVFVFYMTGLYSEKFDHEFGLNLRIYSQVTKDLFKSRSRITIWDRILVVFIDIQKTSFRRFVFAISYVLFVGILVNQLLLTFIFITAVWYLRLYILLFVMIKVQTSKNSALKLVRLLQKYKDKNYEK